MNTKPLIAVAALAIVVSSAYAQQTSQQGIGVGVGIFTPSSSEVRHDLGAQFLSFGLTGTSSGLPSQGAITPEYTLIFANGNGNKLFILPLTVGYQYNFGISRNTYSSGIQFRPYLRPFVGVAYYDYSITDFATGEHSSTKQLGDTYGIEGGLLISSRIRLAATYNYFSQTSGFSFNGLTLSATYSLFNL